MGEITPIHRAAMKGDVAALRRELEAGVPPDQHTRGGYTTPLHYVMCANSWEFGAGHVACVKLLLAAGASPNVSHVPSFLAPPSSGRPRTSDESRRPVVGSRTSGLTENASSLRSPRYSPASRRKLCRTSFRCGHLSGTTKLSLQRRPSR